ncbi:MAG: DUF4175 family protein [Planctomycetaceae bacterium]
MTGTVLERSLNLVAQRLYKLRVLRRQALCWVLLLVPAIVLAMTLPQLQGLISTTSLVLLCVTIVGLTLARWKVPQPTALETARLVEKNRPELNDAVLTAVRADETARMQKHPSILNDWVIDEADKLARGSDWRSVVPRRQMFAWSTLSFLAFCFLITGVVAAGRWGREVLSPESLIDANGTDVRQQVVGDTVLTIEPGSVEMERGTALTVVVRFGRALPTDVVLQLTTEQGAATFTMEPTVDEGVFAARINSVESDATYRVFFGNSATELSAVDRPDFRNRSEEYTVTTYVRPQLEQVDALITPPAYTKKEPQLIEDTLRVTVVEGSTVQLTLHLNKPVNVAELRSKDGTVVPLVSAEPEAGTVTATLEALDDQKFQVYLEDEAGRTAAEEHTIWFKVTRNQRPKIKVTFPGKDTNVSPLQEFQIEAEATDDFGFSDFGLVYSHSGGESDEVSLANEVNSDATKKLRLQHTIEMEKLNAAPDELLSYYFYVEDFAADGSIRRTCSDMMFAEVRRFEEIFRESQQQGQQQQQQQQQSQGNETEKLMQLQRQIMIATWNVQRALEESRSRENATAKAVEDSSVVLQSQQQALQQLQEVKEKAAGEPDMLKIAEGVERDMNKAVQELTRFGGPETRAAGVPETLDAERSSDDALGEALFAEQAAFAGLMRMRAKEHEVSRSQSQGQGQGQNSASQQQLNQLELDNERNRYESERQAQQQQEQNAEQKQQLQILNRLKELARRQQMLNERLKQLESELRAAQTQEEKDEIERELKRLREEQREMLRDVDELRETMDQQSAEQQQQNKETRQQVEEAREQVQQASRAMDEGKLQEAISEGTRAERKFEQLQEEFRNQTSNQFSEAMRDLREQARQMTERQDEIAKQLAGEGPADEVDGRKPSLRNERDRDGLQKKVAEQRDDLERILEQAKKLVEEAEDSEPLLSRRLYDTVRETREQKPEEALEATEILVSRGLWNQGQQAEQIARKGIDDLAQGIEKAADAVLGSEAESLRRAQEEIEALSEQLASEVANATGQAEDRKSRAGEADFNTETSAAEARRAGERGEPEGNAEQADDTERGEGATQRIQRAAAPLPNDHERQRNAGNPSSGDQPQQSERRPGETQKDGEPQEGKPQQEQKPGESQSGQQPGEGKNESPEPSDQPEEGQQPDEGQQPGREGERGQQSGQGRQQGKGQPQQQSPGGQQGQGQQPGQGQQQGQGQGQQSGGRGQRAGGSFLMGGGRESNNGGRGVNEGRPLTGDDFKDWSNRLREVEEILDDPELRNQVAQVRDRARSIRAEFRRHGKEPQWDLVKSQLLDEMTSLQKRIKQELSKMESDRSMVPIDREPVPEEFDELVRRYYELLGQSREGDE